MRGSCFLAGPWLTIFFLVLPKVAESASVDIWLMAGYRTVNSLDIKEVYGAGWIFGPAFSVKIWQSLSLGISYEGGYS